MSPTTCNRRSWIAGTLAALSFPADSLAQRQSKPERQIIDSRVMIGDFVAGLSSAVVDGETHEGVEIEIALPSSQHVKNFGAPADNMGLCVFASMSMAARWHNIRELSDVINKLKEGGGWPEKVDAVFKKFAPGVEYVQYEGTNPAILDKAISESRPACVTYGYGERYKMQTIYHMVMLVHIDAKWAVILDNNMPGTYEWMAREEFLKRWAHPSGKGWAYVMLVPPPPPVPHN